MLTVAEQRVNRRSKVNSADYSKSPLHPPPDSIRLALEAFWRNRRPRRALMVTSSLTAPPVFAAGADARITLIKTGDGSGPRASVECAARSLPFQPRVFDLVLAHHVLCDGDEPELREFERVLEGGGRLVILGLGYWCSRYRLSRGANVAAAIRPLRLCRALRKRDFVIESCSGQHVAGVPIETGNGWRTPLVGFSDQIMIQARATGNQHVVTPLRFGPPRTVGARSTAHESLIREAAS